MIPASNVGLADIFPLLQDQKEMFLQDGFVVVSNILSEDERTQRNKVCTIHFGIMVWTMMTWSI